MTVVSVSVTLRESRCGSPGLFPPLINNPPFSSVSHQQEMFPVLWWLCCCLCRVLGWGRSRSRGLLTPCREFSVHFMVWFDVITVLSVRKRIDLVCLSLLCVSMGDMMPFPFQCELLWPIQDVSDPFWVWSLDEQVWTSPVWSRQPCQP